MSISIASQLPEDADLVVVGCFENETPETARLPEPLVPLAEAAIVRTGWTGGEKQTAHFAGGHHAVDGIIGGLGRRQEFDWRKLDAWIERHLERARANGFDHVAWVLPAHAVTEADSHAERILECLALGTYRFNSYRETPSDEDGHGIAQITLIPPSGADEAYQAALPTARGVVEGILLARDLSNTPGNIATPGWMEDKARALAADFDMKVEVYQADRLEDVGMNGILSVGVGSQHPPRLVRLEWGSEGPIVALVGKGVTFDTGGISLKPPADMDLMKFDKCGATTVLGAALAAARLKLPVRLRIYLPLAENMPDGKAYRPGDIIRCYNGKTVEIKNTDAEGRMMLADAMALAAEEKPDVMVEFSTLTGACVAALGQYGAGLFSPDDEIAEALLDASAAAGEYLWRLPLWPEFGEEMKGNHADLKNSGSRWGGANAAAAFLSHFVGDMKRWAHVDMAGPAHEPNNGSRQRGATGYGVALTIRWLRSLVAV